MLFVKVTLRSQKWQLIKLLPSLKTHRCLQEAHDLVGPHLSQNFHIVNDCSFQSLFFFLLLYLSFSSFLCLWTHLLKNRTGWMELWKRSSKNLNGWSFYLSIIYEVPRITWMVIFLLMYSKNQVKAGGQVTINWIAFTYSVIKFGYRSFCPALIFSHNSSSGILCFWEIKWFTRS